MKNNKCENYFCLHNIQYQKEKAGFGQLEKLCYKELLLQIFEIADCQIPYYAYGDNEAAVMCDHIFHETLSEDLSRVRDGKALSVCPKCGKNEAHEKFLEICKELKIDPEKF
jgi:hypothetical protein